MIIERIRKRLLETNQNWMGVICGATGSAKSYDGLTICLEIDPSFRIDNVVFTPEEFMELLNSGKLHEGSAIMFDEAGVGIPSREWYSISNRLFNYILQTFRHENLAVIFTTPSFDFIDSAARKLFHAYIETQGIDYKNERGKVKYLEIQFNPKLGKVYYKYPRITRGGCIKVIKSLWIAKPPEWLIREYEKKRRKYTYGLKDTAENGMKAMREKQIRKLTTNIECQNCGHKWFYKGKMKKAKCPSCYKMVNVEVEELSNI